MNTKKSSAWERAPYDSVVGQSWHRHICELIGIIVNTANAKMTGTGNFRWRREDVELSVSSKPSETPWHVEGPGCAVYASGPVEALEKLLSLIRNKK